MARRSPGVVRARLPLRPRQQKFSVLPELPRWVVADIHRAEATELWPGEVAKALRRWQQVAREAHRRRYWLSPGCECCAPEPRETLDNALQVLPPRSRALLRARVVALDQEIRRKTLPDPTVSTDLPWWEQRIWGIRHC